jgi:hypothetical protein
MRFHVIEECLQRNCIAAIIGGPAATERGDLVRGRRIDGIAALEIGPQGLADKLGAGARFFFPHLLKLTKQRGRKRHGHGFSGSHDWMSLTQ